jgi:hypothetical protein
MKQAFIEDMAGVSTLPVVACAGGPTGSELCQIGLGGSPAPSLLGQRMVGQPAGESLGTRRDESDCVRIPRMPEGFLAKAVPPAGRHAEQAGR